MKQPTVHDYLGAQMSNLLYALARNKNLDDATRESAAKLVKQWDENRGFHLNNPITASRLEARFFPENA